MNGEPESAVGALLRAAGVSPNARKADLHSIGVREAERMTGVSRQTISVWLRPVDPEGRVYTKATIDKVAAGLGIDRRQLGIAAVQDSGLLLDGSGCPSCDHYREALDREVSLRTLGGTPPAVDPDWANVTTVPPSAADDAMPAHRRVGLARSTDRAS
jgi:hypothetical protein